MLDSPTRDVQVNGPPVAPIRPTGPTAPEHKGHAPVWTFLALLVVAGACGGWWWWHAHEQAPQAKAEPPPMKVPVMTATTRTVPVYRSFPAITDAMRSVTIQARVTGYLVNQLVPDGSDVAAGTLLYRIDPSDYRASLAQAQGQLDQAKAGLDYSRVSQGRNRILSRDGWVSHDTFDQANSTFHQGEASVQTGGASVLAAALNLSRTGITAPFAGRISRSQVFEGSLISVAGTTLNTLVQLDPIYVSFYPAESDLVMIRQVQAQAPIATAVTVGSAPQSHDGPITFIDNAVDRTTGTILIRATIANADRGLLPGQYVTARLHLGDLQGALVVPQTAVGSSQAGRFLMTVGADGKAEQHVVKLGDSDGDIVVVTDGLKAGDRVITGQLQKVKPGAPVQPDNQASAPDTASPAPGVK